MSFCCSPDRVRPEASRKMPKSALFVLIVLSALLLQGCEKNPPETVADAAADSSTVQEVPAVDPVAESPRDGVSDLEQSDQEISPAETETLNGKLPPYTVDGDDDPGDGNPGDGDPGYEGSVDEDVDGAEDDDDEYEEEEYPEVHTIDIPGNWTRTFEKSEVWIDLANKQVIAGGIICMDRGPLEMFVCPLYTKEHESVVAINARSHEIHAMLLGVGANPGKPVQWEPEYKPATGPTIAIDIMWKDEATGEIITRNGREMVQNARTGRELDTDWVFGGSETFTDPEDGTVVYYADAGELVCLSNFSTATMDIPVKSPQDNFDLLYHANTDKIPERGTKVYVIFKPQPPAENANADNENAEDNDADATNRASDTNSESRPDSMPETGEPAADSTEIESEIVIVPEAEREEIVVADDGFPFGTETPEGIAADLARAFMDCDAEMFDAISVEPFGGEGNRADYNDFRANVAAAIAVEAERETRSAGGPKSIQTVFAARHMSLDGPASSGYALYNFQDVMFVDVFVELYNGESKQNRTLVVQLSDGSWRVHPAPHTAQLLTVGLNEEAESTVEFSDAYRISQPDPSDPAAQERRETGVDKAENGELENEISETGNAEHEESEEGDDGN